jgi:hypothetical protein
MIARSALALLLIALLLSGSAAAADRPVCRVQHLEATTVRTYVAAEAGQGVAADEDHFYAVDKDAMAKYRRGDGVLQRKWGAEQQPLLRHLNSCYAAGGRLYCAHSNYPDVPMGSSIEMFDADTLAHAASHSLGLSEEGSLTWFDRTGEGWIAAFAHYGGKGGLPYKDNRYTSLVSFDRQWRRTGGWLYPPSILELMAPYAASGGAIGPDGYLYVTGHDLPEIYVLARPAAGPYLLHLATIGMEAHGQAFSWAGDGSRDVFAADRGEQNRVLQIRLPVVQADCMDGAVQSFRAAAPR